MPEPVQPAPTHFGRGLAAAMAVCLAIVLATFVSGTFFAVGSFTIRTVMLTGIGAAWAFSKASPRPPRWKIVLALWPLLAFFAVGIEVAHLAAGLIHGPDYSVIFGRRPGIVDGLHGRDPLPYLAGYCMTKAILAPPPGLLAAYFTLLAVHRKAKKAPAPQSAE